MIMIEFISIKSANETNIEVVENNYVAGCYLMCVTNGLYLNLYQIKWHCKPLTSCKLISITARLKIFHANQKSKEVKYYYNGQLQFYNTFNKPPTNF